MTQITVDLTGPWRLRRAGTTERPVPATVPGCVHTDLLAAGKIEDPFWGSNELALEWIEKTDWEYTRTFRVPAALLARERVELVAEGLDTLATIELNGTRVASTENMFVEHRLDVKALLVPGQNAIRITFANPRAYIEARKRPTDFWEWNDPVGGASHLRKMQCAFGWDWGPRLPTSGIWRPIFLRGWDGDRIEGVRVEQAHVEGRVRIDCLPTLTSGEVSQQRFRTTLSLAGEVVAREEGLSLWVNEPRVWWPNGLGEQPLYDLELELLDGEADGDATADVWRHRIGLRTIALDRHPDAWGESFQFLVNGVPVFAKGANWIPAHAFVTSLERADYDQLLSSAATANMNLLRVWGGGIYERPEFYALCDEKGLLVWQDFMFACALYPATPDFLASVAAEAACQLQRLRNHACLALLCGSNEVEDLREEIAKTSERREAHQRLFYQVLPAAVRAHAPSIPYWPCSPHHPDGWEQRPSEAKGDAHDWQVWHTRKRATTYLDRTYRFVSEFGMQAYCSAETTRLFAPAGETNVFGPAMENHQKHSAGNSLILEYISHRYRFPKDLEALVYLSQVNQAYCVQTAVEHHRRSMPRTMGSLYWQLDDCWPVASWSSIEFGGRWRALHHAARRFFAPAAVSARLIGTEEVGRINRQISTVEGAELFAVWDGPGRFEGTVGWALRRLDGKILAARERPVSLDHAESKLVERLELAAELARHGKAAVYLQLWLDQAGERVARNTVFFTAPRFLDLPRERLRPRVKRLAARTFELTFRSRTFQHQVHSELAGVAHQLSDDYFDLFPGTPHRVVLECERALDPAAIRKRLRIMALADSA